LADILLHIPVNGLYFASDEQKNILKFLKALYVGQEIVPLAEPIIKALENAIFRVTNDDDFLQIIDFIKNLK
jgi:hypothetical protein